MNIYKENDVVKTQFYQLPKELFGNSRYFKLTLESKVVYSLLRDRLDLSRKNKWVNESGEVYLLFSRENIANLLDVDLKTVTKAFKQLVSHKLIVDKRQGLGKPNVIYVCHIEPPAQQNQQTGKISVSGSGSFPYQNTESFRANDTEYSHTDNNKTENICPFPDAKERLSVLNSLSSECRFLLEEFAEQYKDKFGEKYVTHKSRKLKEINEIIQNMIYNDLFEEYTEIEMKRFIQSMIRVYLASVKVKGFTHNIANMLEDNVRARILSKLGEKTLAQEMYREERLTENRENTYSTI